MPCCVLGVAKRVDSTRSYHKRRHSGAAEGQRLTGLTVVIALQPIPVSGTSSVPETNTTPSVDPSQSKKMR